MTNFARHKKQLEKDGFTIAENIYTKQELEKIIKPITQVDAANKNFRKTGDLFAIMQFFKEIPGAVPKIFNNKISSLIAGVLGPDHFVVKSIYFDKPERSNWFVAYH